MFSVERLQLTIRFKSKHIRDLLELVQSANSRWGVGTPTKGKEIIIQSETESEFLILAGPELNEPIARYVLCDEHSRRNSSSHLDYRNGMFTN